MNRVLVTELKTFMQFHFKSNIGGNGLNAQNVWEIIDKIFGIYQLYLTTS